MTPSNQSTVLIRKASAQDLPAIVAMLADDALGATREDASEPLHEGYSAGLAAIEADPNQLLAVLEVDGCAQGCLQLSFIPGISQRGQWRGQIEGVRIASSLRGQGYGHVLLRWAIAQCEARGCKSVQLTTNASRKDAQRFYVSLGFEASHLGMKLKL